jgi:hypothetical protein
MRTCDGGCKCTYHLPRLALDSSHLYLLARAFQSEQDSTHLFGAVLAAHSCGGSRHVISTDTCIDEECFRLQSGVGARLTDVDPSIEYGTVLGVVQIVAEATLILIAATWTVRGERIVLHAGERSVASAVQSDEEAVVVVNDEDAYDGIKKLVEASHVDAYPIMSLDLARYMFECRALHMREIELLCAQVAADVDRLPNMSPEKANRKLQHAETVINQVVLTDARRNFLEEQGA